jgi:hypothetical protein
VLLFDEPMVQPPSATAVCQSTFHYELKQIPPNFEQLKKLLFLHPFDANKSEDEDDAIQGSLYTTEQLEARVQASTSELQTGLTKFEAFQYKGRPASPCHSISQSIRSRNDYMEYR